MTGTHSAKAGHPGGSLSAADMFTYGHSGPFAPLLGQFGLCADNIVKQTVTLLGNELS